jgi:RES domain-containing protein
MQVFRIARKQFASSLSGRGAALYGARWNSPGIEMIYTAGNRSLAMAEVAVHLSLGTIPDDYMMITIQIPDDITITGINEEELPENWNQFPHNHSTQKIGDDFILENRFCVMQVPSVVTAGDYNFLLNPMHPDFARIHIREVRKFAFDRRLF